MTRWIIVVSGNSRVDLNAVRRSIISAGYLDKRIAPSARSRLSRQTSFASLNVSAMLTGTIPDVSRRPTVFGPTEAEQSLIEYRLSSDIFPLITYEAANVDLIDLPQIDAIYDKFDIIKDTITTHDIRVSTHPSQFFVLASTNQASVDRTVNELNFFSSFMDIIGCPADHNSPINLHINNKQGSYDEIIDRFLTTFNRLDPNCRNRLVIENDDKYGGWNVQELIEHFHPATNIPITFDYLHHKCNPSYDEETAVRECYNTWDTRPLFHYSESREGNNPRAHADYATQPFDTYGLDFDIDMELKMKDRAIAYYYNERELQNA